jgi:hypothetical protein
MYALRRPLRQQVAGRQRVASLFNVFHSLYLQHPPLSACLRLNFIPNDVANSSSL